MKSPQAVSLHARARQCPPSARKQPNQKDLFSFCDEGKFILASGGKRNHKWHYIQLGKSNNPYHTAHLDLNESGIVRQCLYCTVITNSALFSYSHSHAARLAYWCFSAHHILFCFCNFARFELFGKAEKMNGTVSKKRQVVSTSVCPLPSTHAHLVTKVTTETVQ